MAGDCKLIQWFLPIIVVTALTAIVDAWDRMKKLCFLRFAHKQLLVYTLHKQRTFDKVQTKPLSVVLLCLHLKTWIVFFYFIRWSCNLLWSFLLSAFLILYGLGTEQLIQIYMYFLASTAGPRSLNSAVSARLAPPATAWPTRTPARRTTGRGRKRTRTKVRVGA